MENNNVEPNETKKKKRKKRTAAEIKASLINYMKNKYGLMGEATRAIQKRKLELENVMKQSK